MSALLVLWSRTWQRVSFDTTSGRGRVKWFGRAPAVSSGWAVKKNGVWLAVWSAGTHLVFQVGDKRWPMSDEFRAENRVHGSSRRFSVYGRDGVVWSVVYRDWCFFDLTDDDMDLELRDFFVWLARLWSDSKWKSDVVRNLVAVSARADN